MIYYLWWYRFHSLPHSLSLSLSLCLDHCFWHKYLDKNLNQRRHWLWHSWQKPEISSSMPIIKTLFYNRWKWRKRERPGMANYYNWCKSELGWNFQIGNLDWAIHGSFFIYSLIFKTSILRIWTANYKLPKVDIFRYQ